MDSPVPETVWGVLRQIGPALGRLGFYLGGGTALAIQIGHRTSVDLDFFSRDPFDPGAVSEALREARIDLIEAGTVRAWMDRTKVECFHYPYPLVGDLVEVPGIEDLKMASMLDIALMKVAAIGQRGAKKDFLDLYAISRTYQLADLFARAPEKFGNRFATMHFLKSLVWFKDADPEPDPPNWQGPDWDKVKDFFRHEAKRTANVMGLDL